MSIAVFFAFPVGLDPGGQHSNPYITGNAPEDINKLPERIFETWKREF